MSRGTQERPPSLYYGSTPKQRYEKHIERIRAEKRREYKGALGLTIFLVTIIFLAIMTTDKINYRLADAISDSWFSNKE